MNEKIILISWLVGIVASLFIAYWSSDYFYLIYNYMLITLQIRKAIRQQKELEQNDLLDSIGRDMLN